MTHWAVVTVSAFHCRAELEKNWKGSTVCFNFFIVPTFYEKLNGGTLEAQDNGKVYV